MRMLFLILSHICISEITHAQQKFYFLNCDSANSNQKIIDSTYEGVVLSNQTDHLKKMRMKPYMNYLEYTPQSSSIRSFEKSFASYFDSSCTLFMPPDYFKDEIQLNNYIRQYVGLIDDKGDSILLVSFNLFDTNSFCDLYYSQFVQSFRWMSDGSYKYFYVAYSISRNKILKLHVNSRG